MKSLQDRFKGSGEEEFLQTTNILLIYKESHLNLALCHIKMSEFETAIDHLTSLLHYEP